MTTQPTQPATEPGAASAAKPTVSFEDFARLDLRVARVLACQNHPSADKLYVLSLDDGSGQPRQICAGVRENYTPEQLVGRLIVIVANLAPRTIRGQESRGMLLAASDAAKGAEQRRVVVLSPSADIQPGAIVS